MAIRRLQLHCRAFSTLRWTGPRAGRESFRDFYWEEENAARMRRGLKLTLKVLHLYAIQRVQLVPAVQEDVKSLASSGIQ